MPKTELFVGNLGKEISQKDIEEVFDKYGKIIRCDVKSKEFGASFCFLEFKDERDAEDALKAENGKDMLGSSIVVEWAKGKSDRRDGDRRGGGGYGDRRGGGGFRGGDRRGGYGDRDRRGGGFRGGDRNGGGRSLECFNCGETGHFARDCRKGNNTRNGGGGGGGSYRNGGGRREREHRRSSHSRSRSRSR